MAHKVTYEHISKASPVLMQEKINGILFAVYTAYIDRGGNFWILYPKKRISYRRDVPFCKKKVSVREVTILPNPDLKYPPAALPERKPAVPEQSDFSPIEGEQIKIL